MTGLDQLFDRLPRWVLVGGKGGVGKTTCAGALASRAAARGEETLLLSTDPARSLGDALGHPLGAAPRPIPGRPGLHAFQLDAPRARDAFLERWRNVLITIVDRGTYLDRDDVSGLVDAALPGADEAMALLTLLDLERDARWRRILVDTAPTGHTLRLLELPRTFRALITLLDVMQQKHRFMVRALTHRYRGDDADRFLEDMRTRVDTLQATLADPSLAAMVLVTRPEPVVVAETVRYADALGALPLRIGAMVVNALPDAPDADSRNALLALSRMDAAIPRYRVPLLPQPPCGLAALDAWGSSMRGWSSPDESGTLTPTAPASRPVEGRAPGFPLRPLTFVGGKGGVGKTTISCALAIRAASSTRPALVVSTDPAPSVGDALDQVVGGEPFAVAGAEGLFAQQLDAASAFRRFRVAWRERVDALFDSVLGGQLDAAHDRRIMRDLLELAPPGIDEVYALASLGETLEEERYATVIVDPAPTGHLLRLLEMPALALEWTHRLLRLILKYKPGPALSSAGEELLSFAKRTRAIQGLLGDASRSALILVALDEPLVRKETERLVSETRERGAQVGAIIWNRVAGSPVVPLPVHPAVPQFEAPAASPPPRGVDALRAWSAEWRILDRDPHG